MKICCFHQIFYFCSSFLQVNRLSVSLSILWVKSINCLLVQVFISYFSFKMVSSFYIFRYSWICLKASEFYFSLLFFLPPNIPTIHISSSPKSLDLYCRFFFLTSSFLSHRIFDIYVISGFVYSAQSFRKVCSKYVVISTCS